jgi:hypothetical protein
MPSLPTTLRVAALSSCLFCLLACARKPEASKEAPGEAIHSEDEICKLLTADEVAAELKQPVTARVMPSTGQYSAPSCGWLTAEAPDSPGFLVTLFFHPDSEDAPKNFQEKIKTVCNAPALPKEVPAPAQPIAGLGDEATQCRKLLVRKGNNFFYVSRQKGDPAAPWQESAQRLARKVVSRLP